MRPIDADELKRGIEALCKDERASISAATYFALMAFINKMPTIEAETVKHAKWIWMKNYRDCEGDIYSQYKCSCCDFSVGRIYSVEDLTHFCGNCGAKMDGD